MVRTDGGSGRLRASHSRWMAAAPNSPRSLVSRNSWRIVSTWSSRALRAIDGGGQAAGRSLQSTRSRRCSPARATQRCTVATPNWSATWRIEAPWRTAWTISRRCGAVSVFCSWQTPYGKVSRHVKREALTSECLRPSDFRVVALALSAQVSSSRMASRPSLATVWRGIGRGNLSLVHLSVNERNSRATIAAVMASRRPFSLSSCFLSRSGHHTRLTPFGNSCNSSICCSNRALGGQQPHDAGLLPIHHLGHCFGIIRAFTDNSTSVHQLCAGSRLLPASV
jgi:hypothetical protein